MKTPIEALQPVREDGDLGGLSGRPLYINTFALWVYQKRPSRLEHYRLWRGRPRRQRSLICFVWGPMPCNLFCPSYRGFAPSECYSELHRSLLSTNATSLDDLLHGECILKSLLFLLLIATTTVRAHTKSFNKSMSCWLSQSTVSPESTIGISFLSSLFCSIRFWS